MVEVAGWIDAPADGVSQVPAQVRLKSTCVAMENCVPMVPFGVQKRPPFRWIAELLNVGNVNGLPLWEYIPYGDGSLTYLQVPTSRPWIPHPDLGILLTFESKGPSSRHVKAHIYSLAQGGAVPHYDLTVTPAAQAYLDLNNPNTSNGTRDCVADFRIITVEDTTFILNRTATVALAGTTAAARPHEAMVWVRTSQYYRTNSVTVTPASGSPVTATYHAATGGKSDDAKGVGTDVVAKALYDGTVVSGSGATFSGAGLTTLTGQGFTVILDGSLIYISHPSIDFTLTTHDDQGGIALVGIKGAVQRFSDLPQVAHDGFTCRISQEAIGAASDYYVQFQALNTTTGGVWNETLQPGTDLGLDPNTMPVGLKRTGPYAWTLDVLPWTGRTTGNPTLSPDPAFVGTQIRDIGWWKGRLGMTYTGGIVLSASDSPFKYYTTTLAVSKDSDPIGLLPPADTKGNFQHMLVFDTRLVVLGDKLQGIVRLANPIATADTCSLEELSHSPYSGKARPVSIGHKVYYLADTHTDGIGGATFTPYENAGAVIYEVAIDRFTGLAIPEILTKGVPNYIDPDCVYTASSELSYMTFYSKGGSDIWVHQHIEDANATRVQNAVHHWTLPNYPILGMFRRRNQLWVIAQGLTGNLHLLVANLSPNPNDARWSGNPPSGEAYLDWATNTQLIPPVYDPSTDTTTIWTPVPYQGVAPKVVAFPYNIHSPPEGYEYTVVAFGSQFDDPTAVTFERNKVVVRGDLTSITTPFQVGFTYNSYVIPSEIQYMGQDERPVLASRLVIRRVRLAVADLGYIRAEVYIRGRNPRLLPFYGTEVGRSEGDLAPQDAPLFPLDQYTRQDGADVPPRRPKATLTVPVGANSTDFQLKLISDSHMGFKYVGLEWQGDLYTKARRVT